MIPKQLSKFRFLKTFRKHPSEPGWPLDPTRFKLEDDGSYTDQLTNSIYKSKGKVYKGNITSYSYDDMQDILDTQEQQKPQNITYGVLGGYNGLIVIDVDDKKVAEKLSNIWPFSDTFTVLSGGKELPHFYFKCKDYSRVVRFDSSSNKRLLDVQGTSTFVVGPNSYLMSNNAKRTYKVHNEAEVLEIDFNELLDYIELNIGESHKIQKKEKHLYTDKFFSMDPITTQIFKKIHCDEILDEENVDISSNPGDTPFAQSENKKCLHRTDYLWFDHHTQEGGNVIQLYAKLHKIDGIKAKYSLAERAGVTEEIFKQALEYFIKNKQHEMTELLTMKFLGTTPTHTVRSDKNRTPEIYIYKDGIYIPDGVSYINEFIDNILGKWYTSTLASKIVDKIKVRTLIDAEEFFDEADVNLIPVQNGILNLEDDKLYEFTPKLRFFNKLPVKYNDKALCEATLKHFETVLNGEKDILVMQELYGYLLFREYRWQNAFMFYGNGGNGKTITVGQMKKMIGSGNAVNLSLQKLQNEKFSRCELHRKLANLADDIGHAKLEETQVFKELTGGSTITADRKFMTGITFENYAKLVFSANKIPDTIDDTDGFWRRWIMIGFTKKFIPPSQYDRFLREGKIEANHRRADSEIIHKLTTNDELSGVLNWAIQGFKRLKDQRGFSISDSCEEVRTVWRRNVSSVIAFLQDMVEIKYNQEEYEVHEDLFKAYIDYCIKNKTKAENERKFTKYLQEENVVRQRKHVAHGNEWRWQCIKLRKVIIREN